MALTRLFAIVLVLGITMPLVFFSWAEAGGAVGVTYGRVANDLPNEASVVDLLKQNGITMVRTYDASPEVLTALANTGIKVMVMMPNDNLTAAAANSSYALEWVQTNVASYYPATQINGVAVGNEVFDTSPQWNSFLVPAMTNVQAALAQLGLADAVKVTTPVAFDAIQDSYPPSNASFNATLVPVMKPMLDFLQRTGSYLTINLYPYLTYFEQPNNTPLDYALGNSKNGVPDSKTGLVYHSLLDAQLDATYFAMEKLMTSSSLSSSATEATAASAREGSLRDSLAQNGMRASITETGWPSSGRPHSGKPPLEGVEAVAAGAPTVATVANAQSYNNYVIDRVLSGRTGTPHRPDADMDVYIFALFNEDKKGSGADDTEQHFGLFYPNETKVYPFDFHGGGGAPTSTESWCVADPSADQDLLEEEMGYACDSADCSAIEPGGECFEPDTIVAHASYAFNSYYQCNDRASGSCDFDGAACIVYQQPKFGNCVLPSNNLKE